MISLNESILRAPKINNRVLDIGFDNSSFQLSSSFSEISEEDNFSDNYINDFLDNNGRSTEISPFGNFISLNNNNRNIESEILSFNNSNEECVFNHRNNIRKNSFKWSKNIDCEQSKYFNNNYALNNSRLLIFEYLVNENKSVQYNTKLQR